MLEEEKKELLLQIASEGALYEPWFLFGQRVRWRISFLGYAEDVINPEIEM